MRMAFRDGEHDLDLHRFIELRQIRHLADFRAAHADFGALDHAGRVVKNHGERILAAQMIAEFPELKNQSAQQGESDEKEQPHIAVQCVFSRRAYLFHNSNPGN